MACTLPEAVAPHSIQKLIELSPPGTLNCFSHITTDLSALTTALPLIRKSRQRWGAINLGWQHDAIVYEKPNLIFTPLFSLVRESHNNYTGSASFDTLISNLNHTPKPIRRRVLFFVNKDNFSELADLDSFAYSLGIHVWVIPYNLFTDEDFSHEEMLYLKRLNTSPRLFVHPAHLVNMDKQITQNGICHLMKADAPFVPWSAWWSTMWGMRRMIG